MTAGTQPFQIKLSSLLIWGLGLFWMLAMLSADFRDPTFFNPLYPAEGLHNWLSLPGALLGGSMIEIFGPASLLIPWLFVRIIIPPSGSTKRWPLIYHALILLITSTTLYALSGFSSDVWPSAVVADSFPFPFCFSMSLLPCFVGTRR